MNQIICSAETHFCGSLKMPMSIISCCYDCVGRKKMSDRKSWPLMFWSTSLWSVSVCLWSCSYNICQVAKTSQCISDPVNYLVCLRSLSEDRHPAIMMLHYWRARVNAK